MLFVLNNAHLQEFSDETHCSVEGSGLSADGDEEVGSGGEEVVVGADSCTLCTAHEVSSLVVEYIVAGGDEEHGWKPLEQTIWG